MYQDQPQHYNMDGLFLLYCLDILVVLLCGAKQALAGSPLSASRGPDQDKSEHMTLRRFSSSKPEASSLMNSLSPTRIARFSSSPGAILSVGPQPTSMLNRLLNRTECLPAVIVSGGLIIACTILLVSTLLLAWRVCQLSRSITAMTNDTELISNSENCMGAAGRNESKPTTEPEEAIMLMGDSTIQEEMGNVAATEEGETISSKEKVGDVAKGEEVSSTPATLSENQASSKGHEGDAGFSKEQTPTSQDAKKIKTVELE